MHEKYEKDVVAHAEKVAQLDKEYADKCAALDKAGVAHSGVVTWTELYNCVMHSEQVRISLPAASAPRCRPPRKG